ncbi:MAG TPA: hypothetical protein VF980_18705 [Thermoanaerobaculia bacterium]
MNAANVKPDFMDLRTRAELLDLCGDAEAAERLRNLSIEIAREVDLVCYAYQLMWRDRYDEAIDLLARNAAAHPTSWNAWHSLGEAFETIGDPDSAATNYRTAAELTDDRENLELIEGALQRVNRLEAAAS